ncbi:MAG: caspase domain-containing protein [Beijerinckiaceae bacterium]
MRYFLLLLVTALLLAFPVEVLAQKKTALVIGNSAYRLAPELTNPANDAEDLSGQLTALGFEVVEGRDLTRAEMADRIAQFGRLLQTSDVALFFYAGHGVQVGGKNYLLPVDAALEKPSDLRLQAIDVDAIIEDMESRRGTNLVFLDACRDNPFTRSLARALGNRSTNVGSGLASAQAGVGTLIAYATQPNAVAADGDARNSPFTSALLKHIATPGLEVRAMLTRVRNDVVNATRNRQVPWDHSSLLGDVYLSSAPAVTPVSSRSGGGASDIQIELDVWNAVKDAQSADAFRDYLGRFPSGMFRSLAQARLAVLAPDQAPASPPIERAISAPAANIARETQMELTRLGCGPPKISPTWTASATEAMRRFNRFAKLNLKADAPSEDILSHLRQIDDRVCPLICPRGQVNTGGECVPAQTAKPKAAAPPQRQAAVPARTRSVSSASASGDVVAGGGSGAGGRLMGQLRTRCQANDLGACRDLCQATNGKGRACRKIARGGGRGGR